MVSNKKIRFTIFKEEILNYKYKYIFNCEKILFHLCLQNLHITINNM